MLAELQVVGFPAIPKDKDQDLPSVVLWFHHTRRLLAGTAPHHLLAHVVGPGPCVIHDHDLIEDRSFFVLCEVSLACLDPLIFLFFTRGIGTNVLRNCLKLSPFHRPATAS